MDLVISVSKHRGKWFAYGIDGDGHFNKIKIPLTKVLAYKLRKKPIRIFKCPRCFKKSRIATKRKNGIDEPCTHCGQIGVIWIKEWNQANGR